MSISARRTPSPAKFVFIGAGGAAIAVAGKIPHSRRATGYGGFPGQRHLAALRRRRGEQPPPCQGLWQGVGRVATDVGAAPQHTNHRRQKIVAVRTIRRISRPGSSSTVRSPTCFTPSNPRQHPADAGGVARDNVALSEYLIAQVLQTSTASVRHARGSSSPTAKRHEWKEAVAGHTFPVASRTNRAPACSQSSAPNWSPPKTARWWRCSVPHRVPPPPHSSRSERAARKMLRR